MSYTLKIHDRKLAGGYTEQHLTESDFVALADDVKAGDDTARAAILQRAQTAQPSLESIELYENGHLVAVIQ